MNIKLIAFRIAFMLCPAAILISSCKKGEDSPVKPYGKLQIAFANEVDGQPVTAGAFNYTNETGNRYSVDMLKYYVTNFTLIKEDGSEKNFKNYNLVDAFVPSSNSFTLDSVVNGAYTSVRFYLGVDSQRNHTGAQEGALDPVHGMIWTWNTGYIFFKNEGHFKNTAGASEPFAFHFGSDLALTTVTVPVTRFEVKGNERKLSLKLNLNKMFASPVLMDFNTDNNRQSNASTDVFWIALWRNQFPVAFTFDKVQ